MKEMSAFMGNPQVQQALSGLKDDPEFADFFAAIKLKGPAAIAEFWDDEKLLKKIAAKLGPAGAPSRPPPVEPPAEITNLHEAARWCDLEATEDFIAIKKDVNAPDKDMRRPLHLAVAFGDGGEQGMQLVQALMDAGANLEAQDSKQNTPLHYAVGYGRIEYVRHLLSAGASAQARNATGKTPHAIALESADKGNPVAKEADIMALLAAGAAAAPPPPFFSDV